MGDTFLCHQQLIEVFPPFTPARCLAIATVELDVLPAGQNDQIVGIVSVAVVFEFHSMVDFKPSTFPAELRPIPRSGESELAGS